MIVLGIWRQEWWGNLGGKVLVKFDLKMVLMDVKVFLVEMIMLYQKKYLLVHSLSLVHLEYMSVLTNMVVVRWYLGGGGGLKGFSRICSDVGVEPI